MYLKVFISRDIDQTIGNTFFEILLFLKSSFDQIKGYIKKSFFFILTSI